MMAKTVLTIVETMADVPTLIKEPMLFNSDDEAMDFLLDNFYNSRDWKFLERKINKHKNKLIFGFQNKELELIRNIIYIQIMNEEQSERLDEIQTMIELINYDDEE